jgi:diguanylate cyclase (GGDEF)-like protein
MPTWAFPVVAAGGVAVVSALVVAGAGGVVSVAFSLFYVWVVLYALLFFPGLVALVLLATVVAGYTTAHLILGTLPGLVPVVLASTLGIMGSVVAGLTSARNEIASDPLTELLNRRGLDLALERAMQRCATQSQPLTVATIDIDRFRQVNERYGHTAGDRLLRSVAQQWASQLDSGDQLARLRGDDFVLALPDRTLAQGRELVDRLRAAIPAGVTASAGVATWRSGDSVSMLLARADAALYEAKRAGRNRTFVDRDDVMAVQELRHAVEDGQMVLYYQPKVSLRPGRITGFEALVRWQHPQRGMLPPSEFIGLAEDSGLIVQLGAWVLAEACEQAASWARAFPEQSVEVAVNVAGRQLDDPTIIDTITQVLTASGLPPRLLSIEVTETMLGENLDGWVERLWELRRLGVHVAMDDFGTGYSSLHQLRHLPVSTIKIDRSFVADLTDSPEAATLVSAMIGIGKGLSRSVIAEGVETVGQLEALTRLDCDEVQGFLFGRPLPHEAAAGLLRQQERIRELVHAGSTESGPCTDPGFAELVGEPLSLEQTVRPLLDHLVAASGLESAYLTRIDWDRLEQTILHSVNSGELQITEGLVIDWSDTVCRRSLENGPARTDAVPEVFPDVPAVIDLGLQSYATAPVVLPDGSIFGTLCVASRERTNPRDELMALLSLYSRIIGDRLAATDAPGGRPDPAHSASG